MFDEDLNDSYDMSATARGRTIGAAATWLGFLAMLVLTAFTAVHAINLAMWHGYATPESGDVFTWLQIGGVVLVEVFALITGVMFLTHALRAQQKPAGLAIEITWLVFAALNLVSSFAVESTGTIPAFVGSWVTYGLPISALVMGALFWIMLRLDPEMQRADDESELTERFKKLKHAARLDVMGSPQMRSVVRQMTWQQLPPVIGRQMNLSESQIRALTEQAPDLLDLNQNEQANFLARAAEQLRQDGG